MIIKLKDVNIIEQATTLIRDKFKIDLNITRCSIEAGPAFLSIDPQLKIESIVVKDHGGWTEHINLEYSILGEDLKDGSLVDELIGGDLSKQAPDMRQVLRLAFILYDGIRYATTGTWKIEYAGKGWLPKVTSIQRHSYVK